MIIAILDHEEHQLFIEQVSDSDIINAGGEEEYIISKYKYDNFDQFSWEYLTKRTEVFGTDEIKIHYN